MRNRDLPAPVQRTAIFWVLFTLPWLWPFERLLLRLVDIDAKWLNDAADICSVASAAVMSLAYLLGRRMFQDTQNRLARTVKEDHRMLSGVHEALSAIGVIRREPPVRLIRSPGHEDAQDKYG